MRISDWSSDVCSSDLHDFGRHAHRVDDLVSSLSVVLPFVGVGRHQIGDHLVLDGRIRVLPQHDEDARRLLQEIVLVAEGIGAEQLQRKGSRVVLAHGFALARSEEHTSELQSLMRISYAVFCLKKKKKIKS